MNTIPPFLLRNKKIGFQRVGYRSWRYRGITIRGYGRQYSVEPFTGISIFVERFNRLHKARAYADWLAEKRRAA